MLCQEICCRSIIWVKSGRAVVKLSALALALQQPRKPCQEKLQGQITTAAKPMGKDLQNFREETKALKRLKTVSKTVACHRLWLE